MAQTRKEKTISKVANKTKMKNDEFDVTEMYNFDVASQISYDAKYINKKFKINAETTKQDGYLESSINEENTSGHQTHNSINMVNYLNPAPPQQDGRESAKRLKDSVRKNQN